MSPDLIASTLATALSAGAVSNAADAFTRSISEAYESLQSLLRTCYGHHREAIEALEQLEDRPWSEGRRLVLAEELRVVDLEADIEIVRAVESLQSLLRHRPGTAIKPMGPRSDHPRNSKSSGSQAV